MGVPINNVTRRVVYAASGTGPYAFTFEILAATDIAVYRDDTLLTLTTNYTVTINPNGTGSVTLTAAPTGATQIAIVGNRTISRTTDFVTGGDFFANTLNDELDQQTIFAQQNAEGLQRALQAPQTDPTSINMTLPGRTARANKTLSFDANGNPTPGVSAADVANAVTYASNAAASATAAAASASAASSSASSASGSASTATTQASNASTSATNAANSASAASTSATNAASSASTAATQASNASTSATNAASSASAASTSASNAATSATNASNSASSASTSATNASNSATAAANSATSAAASASAAANTFDSFDDRYLGTKASDPTLDNDGNALVSGALYFSTSQNIMKVYDGASWIAATSAGNTSLLRFRYIATAGQTSFSGADSNSATLTYTVNNIVVFLNGVALDQTEYTATSGTSVVLTTGAALNDELVIVAFKSFVTADMVPASTGGTYAGNLTYAPGTANHVLYLNGSKVISGSANMTFNGTTLTVNDITDTSLTANRVVYAGTGGNLLTSSNLSFDGTNLGVGTSSPASTLHVTGLARICDANAYLLFRNAADNTSNGVVQFPDSGAASIVNYRNTDLTFGTNNNTRGRFTSGGSFLVGSHTNAYKLVTVDGSVYPYNSGSYYCANGAPGTSDQFSDRSNNGGDAFYHRFIHTASGGWWGYRSDYDSASTNTGFNPFQYYKTSVLKFQVSVTGQITAQGSYDATTASAANLFVTSGGVFQRSTSSIKYKTQVESIEHGKADAILNLRPVWYRSTCEADNPDWSWYGLIAEEVAEIEPRLVHWGYNDQDYEIVETEDKRERKLKSDAQLAPEGVQYDRMTVLLLDIVKRQQSRLEALEAEVQALKGNA